MSSDIVFPLTAKDFEKHCVLSECGISHLCVIVTNTQDSQNVNKKGLFWLYGGLALLLGGCTEHVCNRAGHLMAWLEKQQEGREDLAPIVS